MSPRRRKELDPNDPDELVQQALRLRYLMDRAGLDASRVAERLTQEGVKTSEQTVKNWMRGDNGFPLPAAIRLGPILGLKDYRYIYPDPDKVS